MRRHRSAASSLRREGNGVRTRSRRTRRRRGTSPRHAPLGWTIAKYALLTVAGVALFFILSDYAYQERGYKALGGEVFALLLPVLYYTATKTVQDAVRSFEPEREGKEAEIQNRG